jgi:hypothetical protein
MPDHLLDPVLDPDTMLAKLDEIERQRTERPNDAHAPVDLYRQIRDALTSEKFRAETPSAATVRTPGDQSRPPATVYLHPHVALSQFQSVIAYCFEAQAIDVGDVPATEHGFRHWLGELEDRFRRFGPCDIRWIEPALLNLATDLAQNKYPFADKRPPTVPLGDRARVVIVGDWATGLPQARNVARSIRTTLDATPAEIDCHVVHLGDTYYSGTEEEYERIYLPLWPVSAGSRTGSWSLAGNHDIYSGAHGYFKVLLGDARFAAQDRCSYFCLGNDHWRFVGLDDSYTDPDRPSLAGGQIEWLSGLVATGQRPSTILLTHHQPFSAWEVVTSDLAKLVGQALGGQRIEAWIWGHEHRAAVYEPGLDYRDYHDFAQYTAIAGHGGVPNLVSGPAVVPPVEAVDQTYLRWQNSDYFKVADDTWSYGGYAVVDIDLDIATIQFFTETGQPRTGASGAPVAADRLTRLR